MTFGFLNVHKPVGPTSHDIVAGIRRGIQLRRVGHAGTLDPMAEGVLIVALGQATRLVEYITASQKTYVATVTLGLVTDTYDAEGTIVDQSDVLPLSKDEIEAILNQFRGEIQQMPPAYSAIKISGKTAYARKRAGEDIVMSPRPVTLYQLDLLEYEASVLRLRAVTSPGTYIRSLAHDIGQALGVGAMLSGLVRTASGQFTTESAVSWTTLVTAFEEGDWHKHLLPADLALQDAPCVHLTESEVVNVLNGMPVQRPDVVPETGRAHAPDGEFVAVMEGIVSHQIWQPRKVFKHSY